MSQNSRPAPRRDDDDNDHWRWNKGISPFHLITTALLLTGFAVSYGQSSERLTAVEKKAIANEQAIVDNAKETKKAVTEAEVRLQNGIKESELRVTTQIQELRAILLNEAKQRNRP